MTMKEAPKAPAPDKLKFRETKLPEEPNSDVKLHTEDGMILRERVKRVLGDGNVSYQFTYTRLNENDNVVQDANGNPMIFRAHEISLMGENAERLGEEGVKDALKSAREIGAARARAHFKGLEIVGDLMASRLRE